MKLKHPDSKHTVETSRDKAEAYIAQGWVEVKAPAKTAAKKPASDDK